MARTKASANLTRERALIFRVMHRDNVSWTLRHGLHCQNSESCDPGFVSIGNEGLIDRRREWPVPVPPGGVLADYIPFYFTPFSPMLLQIKTGNDGIRHRSNHELVILVTSLHKIMEHRIPFLFTDVHAASIDAKFYSTIDHLDKIDFGILQDRDFKHDVEDPRKINRYQAEALVYRRIPVHAIQAILCYDDYVREELVADVHACGIELKVITKPDWFFT